MGFWDLFKDPEEEEKRKRYDNYRYEYAKKQKEVIDSNLDVSNDKQVQKPMVSTPKSENIGKKEADKEKKVDFSCWGDNVVKTNSVTPVVYGPPTAEEYYRYNSPRPVYREKKNIIIFAIENTSITKEHKNQILKIVEKIAKENQQALFMFLRIGNDKKYFNVVDYASFEKNKIIENLITSEEKEDENVDYTDVLNHINEFLVSTVINIDYKDKRYETSNNSIIFIGTGKCQQTEHAKIYGLSLITKICSKIKVKTLKYFCMEDYQTIDVATLGFPIIGHIVTDFYK